MHIRLHASRIDVSTDIDLSDSELEEDHWGPHFSDLQWSGLRLFIGLRQIER
jgi:hypothetical protein